MALTRSHKDELENKKYRNWVKAGLSLKYLKDGISDFADECAKLELDRILQKLGLPSGSSCNQCTMDTLRPAHAPPPKSKLCPVGHSHCKCLRNNTTSCQNNICGRIYDEIVGSHGTQSPNWKNTDISKWTTDPWEIAKRFINAPGYEATRSASDTDVAGLLHLFSSNTGFQGHMKCAINLFDKIRNLRNALFHSPAMELDDQQLTDGINDIITILSELKDKECSKQAIHKLNMLQHESFIITTETEAEVCRAALASITQITKELKSIQEDAKRDIALKQEEANKDISLRLEEANKDISLRRDEAVKMFQDTADTLNSRLQKEMAELSDTVKTLELEMKSSNKALELEIKSLNERVNTIEQKVKNLKTVEDNTTEHLKKMENIIALKRKLKERYRTYYIKTSQSPLRKTENDIEISQVYVLPNMTKVKEITSKNEEKKEHTVQILDYRGIFLTDDKQNKRIYILGDVGSGKSAFCKMMMRNWCQSTEVQYESADEDVRTLGQFELLFYLPLRTFTDEDSLLEMITWYYGDICTKYELLNILQHISERCLVLADGIDEWKPTKVGRRRAHETLGLPTTDKMDHVTIVMTSRPSAQGILKMEKSNYEVKIRIDGIRDVITFVEKLYPKSHSGDILRKLGDVPIKGLDLKKTPLLLQQIVWLQQQNIDIGKSISEVYSNVVNIAFRWNQKDTEKAVVGHTLSAASKYTDLTFPDQINSYPEFKSHSSVIFGLGKMAFEIMTQGYQLLFGAIELNKNGIDDYLRTEMLGTGLLTEEVRFDNSKENTQFYFTHTSFLEYFAALFIASHVEKDKMSCSDSPTCHSSIFDIIMERCHSIQDVIRLENMLVMVCGLVPSLINNVFMLMYESLKQSHIFEQKDISCITYNALSEQYSNLAYRCISECKLNDPQRTLNIPCFAVEFKTRNELFRKPEETAEALQYFDPLTVRCCISLEHFSAENMAVFKNLQILKIIFEFNDPTDNELSSLAEYITQTVTLRYISMIHDYWHFPDRDIHTIDLSKHDQLQSLVLQGVRHIRINQINTVNLNQCVLRGTTCSLLLTHAEKLKDLEISDILFRHDELSDWIKCINGSVLLETMELFKVCCSDHPNGCSHVLEFLHHTQLQRLDVSNTSVVHFKNVSTLNLKLCKLVNPAISFSLTDKSNQCQQICLNYLSLKHDELSVLAKFITRSVSLKYLRLVNINCLDHTNCRRNICLSRHTQLESLEVDRSFSCDKINTSKLIHCKTNNTEVLHCLRDSINLRELRLVHRLRYSKEIHGCVLTLPMLYILGLYRINIEELVMIPEMKCLKRIELNQVNMSESSFLHFLESLLTLNQSVECEVLFNWNSPLKQYMYNYLSVNKDKFEVHFYFGSSFCFRSLKEHAEYQN